MPFQRVELFKNNHLRLIQAKPANAGWAKDEKKDNKCKFFPKTYYKYNNKIYRADNSIQEYDKSIVFKRIVNIDNELDVVLFYDKKTFDTEVERIKSYRKPSATNRTTEVQHTSKRTIVVKKQERTLSDDDIERAFDIVC